VYKPKTAGEDKGKTPGSVFSLLFIDPFAGLDPAAREIELSRHMAERAMYQFQRMPRLLDWQLSLVLAKSLTMPESQNLLAAVDRFSTAVEAFPKQIAKERVAIVKDLAANEPKLQALLAEFRKTFEAGGDAAKRVNETVLALDSFVGGFDKASVPDATNPPVGKPFDVTEYGSSAAQIARAARALNTLANSLSQWEGSIVRAGSAGTELVDHVFWRAVAFVLISLAGVVAGILLCRAVEMRSRNRSMKSA
jgi:hypothetical protein